MGTIMIRCPTTNQLVSTGVETDGRSFETLPSVSATPFRCPACGELHAWSTDQAALMQTGRPDR